MKPLKLAGLELTPPLVLAPMAGITNTAFRRLCAELGGVGLFYSEMLSARALRHETPGKSLYLGENGEGRPLCVQIFASNPAEIGPAVERGSRWSPEVWDLNCGCPAPEIRRQGAGSALMESPARARELVRTMRRSVKGPLVFKIRAASTAGEETSFGRMCADEGADAIVLHARSIGEKFGRPARWGHITDLVGEVDIPVIGNGDVKMPEDVMRMMEVTGCRGVMIGRAAAGKPWIFRKAALLGGFTVPSRRFTRKSDVFHRYGELLKEVLSHPRDIYRLRKFTEYFSKNFKFGHELWKRVQNAGTVDEALEVTAPFFERNGEEDRLDD